MTADVALYEAPRLPELLFFYVKRLTVARLEKPIKNHRARGIIEAGNRSGE